MDLFRILVGLLNEVLLLSLLDDDILAPTTTDDGRSREAAFS